MGKNNRGQPGTAVRAGQ